MTARVQDEQDEHHNVMQLWFYKAKGFREKFILQTKLNKSVSEQ